MKGSARPDLSELQIHIAAVQNLKLCAKPGVLWIHPANGEHRDIRTAAKLRAMGTLAGASDLLLFHDGKFYALELKRPGGRLSDVQREFLSRFEAAGGYTGVAWGLDPALDTLKAWGLLR